MEVNGLNEVLVAIGSIGFPSAIATLLLYFLRDSDKRHQEQLQQMTNVIQNNTLALQRILDKLDAGSVV